jgi:SAM-dependent methyltransferase
MNPPRIFDRRTYAKRRARAERLGVESLFVDDAAQSLFERVSAVNRTFGRSLDLGSRRQSFARLEPLAESWVRAPLFAPREASMDNLVAVDEECLPFADSTFDLVASVHSLHAINDLPGTLLQIRKLLAPDGLFVAALLGGTTLRELRHAFAAGENETLGGVSPRVAPFADVRDLGGLLQRAGFSLPVADIERVTVRYRQFYTLVDDLRALGETNALTERSRKPLRRATLAAAVTQYIASDSEADGRLRATFDTIYLTGWAPSNATISPPFEHDARAKF